MWKVLINILRVAAFIVILSNTKEGTWRCVFVGAMLIAVTMLGYVEGFKRI